MRRPSYADVAATLALVLAMGTGGAYAAELVTADDLARNAVTSAKIKNGQVRSKDLAGDVTEQLERRGPAGPAGAQGVQGPSGPAGAPGQRGVSAWDTIPSGTTVTGDFMDGGYAPTGYDTLRISIPFPARLHAAPRTFASAPDASTATGDPDDACAGTVAAPTAPAGQVCVYYRFVSGVNWVGAANFAGRGSSAFYLGGTVSDISWDLAGTWAYTAP